jgi:hypothetical protein
MVNVKQITLKMKIFFLQNTEYQLIDINVIRFGNVTIQCIILIIRVTLIRLVIIKKKIYAINSREHFVTVL